MTTATESQINYINSLKETYDLLSSVKKSYDRAIDKGREIPTYTSRFPMAIRHDGLNQQRLDFANGTSYADIIEAREKVIAFIQAHNVETTEQASWMIDGLKNNSFNFLKWAFEQVGYTMTSEIDDYKTNWTINL